MADPRVTQPSVRIAWVAPSYTTAKPGEAEALDLMMSILARARRAGFIARWCSRSGWRRRQGGWYGSSALDDTRVQVSATPARRGGAGDLARGDQGP